MTVCINRMIAAFSSGASYSLVSGITQGNKFQGAFTTGVLFAAFQGALHKARDFMLSLPKLTLVLCGPYKSCCKDNITPLESGLGQKNCEACEMALKELLSSERIF